jgi:hypothetical protein
MPSRRSLIQATGSGLAAAAFAPLASRARQATPMTTPVPASPESAAPQTTALIVSSTNDPLRVAGSDGMDHLEYDLIVTNTYPEPVTIALVEVLGADGQLLQQLEGDALAEITQPILGFGPTKEIPGSSVVGVVMDVVVARDEAIDLLDHRITYRLPADSQFASIIGSLVIEGPLLTVDPRQAVSIASPLHGPGWLTFNGCGNPPSLHRSIRLPIDGRAYSKPETFAIDWIQMVDGRPFTGDGARNEQWYCHGAEVTSATAGTVVEVSNGMPDQTPNTAPANLHQPVDFGENHVTVQMEDGVWAFYGHLIADSIKVKVGDSVVAGQVLGLLGNSGNSTAPHLHFGLLDGPDPLANNSLPMVFDSYMLMGAIDEATGGDRAGSRWVSSGDCGDAAPGTGHIAA